MGGAKGSTRDSFAVRRGLVGLAGVAMVSIGGASAYGGGIGFKYQLDEGDGDAQADSPFEEETTWTDFFRGWTGRVELGLNGSSGNTEAFNFRSAASATRTTERIETSGRISYTYGKNDGEETTNRGRLNVRNDWLLPDDSPWRVFATGDLQFDRFQDWDWRAAAFAGVGYEFIDTERTFLLGRVGAGASREIGGSDNAINPEGLIGVDFRYRITERQRFTASADLYPDLDDFGEYRADGRAEYEILIDEESNLSLTLGVETRYDSQPGEGFRRNDFDYYALLVWTF